MESGIKRNGYGLDDYFNVVEKPYWKYRMESEEFDSQARKTTKVFPILEKITFPKLIIPKFQKDPCQMKSMEYATYYNRFTEQYQNNDKEVLSEFTYLT